MKRTILYPLSSILCLLLLCASSAWAYTLTWPLSPADAAGAVRFYIGVWCPTNTINTSSNVWTPFGTVLNGTTNLAIPSTVPSPSYLATEALSTNFVLSSPTNYVLYNTNTLAAIYTNLPVAVPGPATNSIMQ